MQNESYSTGRSFLSWIGGKSLLADRIIPLIPEHHCYCEVFAGAAWLLFKKPESEVEIINDINVELVTLYRVVKNHLEEFIRYLKWMLVAREEFARFNAANPDTLTDIQRAVRFYYLVKTGYGSRIKNPTFSVGTSRPSNFNLLRIEEELSAAHLRLSRVYVENLPYQQLIERFDKPHTFFYVDPPYYGCEDYYGKGIFAREDFARLREQLSGLQGRFCLSINDTPEIREIFDGFRMVAVPTRYSVANGKSKAVGELLITNYDPVIRQGVDQIKKRRKR
ncbi:DNA adenine methylase [Methylocaldum sp.]|uniref:DNA adenine methylase n=1 Tax=Methylocaldum sp. TaxID=1969727 RepID=UPI002D4E69F3|nr:DNA adenine methylase [Methylocaldum sp.]HYE35517.1 DNA adenine methylase [Methylocaldum sp.]